MRTFIFGLSRATLLFVTSNRRVELHKSGQLFVGTHDGAVISVAAMASAAKIGLPWESTPETQPQLQPALLRLSAMISQYFTRGGFCLICSPRTNDKISLAHEHAGNFKEW